MANFPTSVSTNSNLYIAVNGLQTTLAASILATDTTIQLASTTSFPTTGYVTIDNSEVVNYTGISGSNLTGCIRGADGTTAAPHTLGVTVGLTIVAAHHNLLKDEIIAIETALGAGYAQSSANTANAIVKRDGSGNFSAGTITAALTGNASTATKATNLAGGVAGSIPYQSATDTTGFSAAGSSGDVVLSGGTGAPTFTTPTSNATASTIMERDSNANVKVNAVVENFSTTVTAAGTTSLTAATSPIQQFTGTTTQTVTLPDATTLSIGFQIVVLNRSTGAVTVNNHGGSLQKTVPAATQYIFTATSISTSNGVWDVSSDAGTGTVTSVSGTTNQITSTGGTTPVLAIANPLTLPGAMTAGGNIAMGANKITGLANGTASTDAAAFGQIYTGFQAPVQSTNTSQTTSTSSTYANTNLAATITPTSSSHRIKVTVTSTLQVNGASTVGHVSIKRGTTELSSGGGGFALVRNGSTASQNGAMTTTFSYIDSPATTSATTYTKCIKNDDNSTLVADCIGPTEVMILEEIV
jgi:hypothetical protein